MGIHAIESGIRIYLLIMILLVATIFVYLSVYLKARGLPYRFLNDV